jgi:hypothetical protein
MKCISVRDCQAWADERGVVLNDTASSFSRGPILDRFRFPTPVAARAQGALLQGLVEALTRVSPSLLWITDWPLYKAHEMALILRIRAGYGESRPLLDAPGHLFDQDDRDILEGMLTLIAAFGWDAYFVPGEGKSIVFASHHELIEVFTLDGVSSLNVRELLSRSESTAS